MATDLLRLILDFDHLRIPIGALGIVEGNGVLGKDRNGDVLPPRSRIAGAAKKHLKVGDERRKLA